MPSQQTNIPQLDKDIAALRDRMAMSDGLSVAAQNHLAYLELWRKLAGRDWVLVIEPRGALGRPGERAKAKLVCVTDQTAADIIALAPARGQRARLANEDEIKLYHERNARQREQVQIGMAQAQALVNRQVIQALLGQGAGPLSGLAPAQAEEIPQPDVSVGPVEDPGADLEIALEPGEEEGAGANGGSAPAPAVPIDQIDGLTEKMVEALRAAGYDSLDRIADAAPSELIANVEGVGEARAAQLITLASEARAKLQSETDGDQTALPTEAPAGS